MPTTRGGEEMAEGSKAEDTYVMGRSGQEAERLTKLSRYYDLPVRRLLEDAGIATGMRVLDVGTGAGIVAMTAAHLVGPSGAVTGADINPIALETARASAE